MRESLLYFEPEPEGSETAYIVTPCLGLTAIVVFSVETLCCGMRKEERVHALSDDLDRVCKSGVLS